MHDYSRDIMLANAQQDMEVNLAKMQLNKKVALTKSNTDKAAKLRKENEELGYMFVPTQVYCYWLSIFHDKIYKNDTIQQSIDLIQGKSPEEISAKLDKASIMIVEILGSSDFCA